MNRERSAFTVVELSVTVAVILILVALGMPSMLKFQAEARRALCLNNLRQIFAAFNAFAMDNDNLWPARVGLDANSAVKGNFVYFTRPYLSANNNYGQWANGQGKTYICPELYRIRGYSSGTSYAVNGHLYDSFATPALVNKARILQPTRTVLIGDGCWVGGQFTSWIDETRLPGCAFPAEPYDTPNHGKGGGNLMFCDGHAEYWPDTGILSQLKYRNGSGDDIWLMK